MIYFTRGLGIAPGVGDVIAETHISSSLTQTFFYVQNHRGDTIALVDESGNTVGTYEYNAWGEIVAHTGQDAYFTFSSKHFDEDAKLYYYGFRWSRRPLGPGCRHTTRKRKDGLNPTQADLMKEWICIDSV